MKIEVGKEYKTRSNKKAIIYAVNGSKPYVIHGAIHTCIGLNSCSWTEEGGYCEDSKNDFDLMCEWQEPLDFDWSILPPWMRYIAMDSDGQWHMYKDKPHLSEFIFYCIDNISKSNYAFIPKEYAPKNFKGNWKDSLYEIDN